MDDPWDSPWTTVEDDKSRTPRSVIVSDLETPSHILPSTSPPPRVPPALTSSSPWADEDDGFGDWTSPVAPQTQTPSGWDHWAGSTNGQTSNPHFAPGATDERFGTSPIVWPDSIEVSAGLKKGPNKTTNFPQPSPDPWASDFPEDSSLNAAELPAPSEVTDHVNDSSEQYLASTDVSDHQGPLAPAAALINVSNHGSQAEETDSISPSGVDLENKSRTPVGGGTPKETVTEDDADTTSDAQTSGVQSRRDSRCSDKSNLVHERQDSPITSIDEDSKIRSQSEQRKELSKVQELVDLFDGLARVTMAEPLPRRDRGRSPLARQPGSEDHENTDEAGFSDFEDAEEQAESLSQEYSESSSDDRTATPKVRSQHPLSRPEIVSSHEDTSFPKSAAAADNRKRRGTNTPALRFDIPLENLDRVFSGAQFGDPQDPNQGSKESIGEPDSTSISIPDRILSDSFSAVSERKTWYRVSRQGSSRKHNAGDDENYRRVAWPTSVVREETIKIVRRWMEVDSITGRATLGGGISKVNIFGWDSKAEPVALDKVFGKKPVEHSRSASVNQANWLASTGHLEQKTSVGPRSPIQRPSSLVLPVAPDFGWGSGDAQGSGPGSSIFGRGGVDRPRHLDDVVESAVPQSRQPPSAQWLTTSQPTVHTNNVQSAGVDIDEDDDEWGEMMTSPSITMASVSGENAIEEKATRPNPFHPVQVQALRAVDISSSRNETQTRPKPSSNTSVTRPGAIDPWVSANLSIFDSAGFATSSLPIHQTQPRSGLSFPADKLQHSVKGLQPPCSAATPLAITRNTGTAHDSLASQIIGSLPNLSYMLR